MLMSNECFLTDTCKKAREKTSCGSEQSFCQKLFKMEYLYTESQLSKNQWKHIGLRYDEDGTDRENFVQLKEISSNIEEFVKNGNNLYIHSAICGNGKTAWSIRLMQCYFASIWHKCDFSCHGLYINVPRYLIELKNSISNPSAYVDKIKENVLNADLVIFDEIGTKSATPYEYEHLLSMINGRIDCGKSNIYTSNLSNEELMERLGDRLYSRIVNLSKEIVFYGKDKRRVND